MAVKGSRWREFSQFVSNHVFGHKHGDELLAVVNGQGDADEFGQYGGSSRPGLDYFAVARVFGPGYFLQKMTVNERPFLQRTRHLFLLPQLQSVPGSLRSTLKL